jgi:hypothetical protein
MTKRELLAAIEWANDDTPVELADGAPVVIKRGIWVRSGLPTVSTIIVTDDPEA